jgi:hypothetical protein
VARQHERLQRGFGDFGKGGQVMRLVFLFLTLSTGDDLTECEKKASVFRKVYANKKGIGPWSKEL